MEWRTIPGIAECREWAFPVYTDHNPGVLSGIVGRPDLPAQDLARAHAHLVLDPAIRGSSSWFQPTMSTMTKPTILVHESTLDFGCFAAAVGKINRCFIDGAQEAAGHCKGIPLAVLRSEQSRRSLYCIGAKRLIVGKRRWRAARWAPACSPTLLHRLVMTMNEREPNRLEHQQLQASSRGAGLRQHPQLAGAVAVSRSLTSEVWRVKGVDRLLRPPPTPEGPSASHGAAVDMTPVLRSPPANRWKSYSWFRTEETSPLKFDDRQSGARRPAYDAATALLLLVGCLKLSDAVQAVLIHSIIILGP
ncbi:hypothetical protein HRR81_003357 [Exophiala dermatitidis]|nr:hypothetical protein HRR73_001588 [Exophiala dermatitidis]KAJ4532502.1 hypothetical protein HRR76_007491 [Exophiala dermatitidis]KAJ4573651.1 hypothetical protein HRR79_002662 [Exophiala dermatitidis]KAJ4576905.1 hypothetical protein HRR81_003357 [Exophiala dermatitidis]KAJ4623591.1 hypothetical protein HRR85_000452 [Exophiala dermatitidis]